MWILSLRKHFSIESTRLGKLEMSWVSWLLGLFWAGFGCTFGQEEKGRESSPAQAFFSTKKLCLCLWNDLCFSSDFFAFPENLCRLLLLWPNVYYVIHCLLRRNCNLKIFKKNVEKKNQKFDGKMLLILKCFILQFFDNKIWKYFQTYSQTVYLLSFI